MTDDLNRLKQALKTDLPAPDPSRKAADIAAAMARFDAEHAPRTQENRSPARPTPERGFLARILSGGERMLNAMTSRAGLATTTGLVTAGLALFLVLPQEYAFGPGQDTGLPEFSDSVAAPQLVARERDGSSSRLAMDKADQPESMPADDTNEPERETGLTVPAANDRLSDPIARETALAEKRDNSDESAAPASPSNASKYSAETIFWSGGHVRMEGETETVTLGDTDSLSSLDSAAPIPMTGPPNAEPGLGFGEVVESAPSEVWAPPDTEDFANEAASGVSRVADAPVSTFSVDVDTAAWSVVRSSLVVGQMPPPDAVRIEEMVNYFPYAYPAPGPDGAPFAPTINVSQTPWNPDTRILHIGIQGMLPDLDERPPLNLVFLIDTSGSMQDANKLPLLKHSLRMMLGELRLEDSVAIVTYAGNAGMVLEPTPAGEPLKILAALDRLEAGGATAGQAGLEQAFAVAERMAEDGDVSRILLATDGDFNVGIEDPDALEEFIATKRDSGTYLSVLGFGRGNLDDATMQALAQSGNGQAAYIDTISEAMKVLVDQLSGTLFPIADDVKIQVEFNPAEVSEYRLIGYETRALRREDFNNDRIDAGEIGAGHQVTALYEVTPVGSPAVLHDPLRYGEDTASARTEGSDELGFLRVRYKLPGDTASQLIEQVIPATSSEASVETRFATAIAGFGQLLRNSPYLGQWSWTDAATLAQGSRGEDPFGYRAEAVRLMGLARTLAQ